MTNLARFTVDSDPSANGGIDVLNGAAGTLVLEAPTSEVWKVSFATTEAADVNSPLASKSAPELTLNNGAGDTGPSVDADTPASPVTVSWPASGAHSYIVRCTVNNGVNTDGSANDDYVFERIVSIRSPAGLRKIVGTEGTQYGPRGWADAQNEFVDAAGSGVSANVQTFTVTDTWMKPANAVWHDVVMVGPGGDGGAGGGDGATMSGSAGGGGGGGGAGEIVRATFHTDDMPAACAATLISTQTVLSSGLSFYLVADKGSDGRDAGATDGSAGAGGSGADGIDGGAGAIGTNVSGAPNSTSGDFHSKAGGGRGGAAQSGGAPDAGAPGGNAGFGYGAGGGGGGGGANGTASGADAGGGGGGAGGYGPQAIAADGSAGADSPGAGAIGVGGAGGAGAGGLIVITTWTSTVVV